MSRDNMNFPHRRLNILNGDWVLVSPHRTQRPWQGKVEDTQIDTRPQYDSNCYLCPGNERAGGHKNPDYEHTFVFKNDFAALLPEEQGIERDDDLFVAESIQGVCRVICFSPRHDLSLAEMAVKDISKVIDLWADQIEDLGKTYKWVQVFENKGDIMGCSNPHPHGQVWAGSSLPNEPFKENREQENYHNKNQSVLLMDYLSRELNVQERIIVENEHWAVLTPFWAVWPYETILLPKRHILRLPDMTPDERQSLADILKKHLVRYDNLFETSFPYTMGWHGAPTQDGEYPYWQLHAHFYPPLLRSATVKKFMVGYEMLAEAQRDITQEQAVANLKALDEVHYKEKMK